LTNTLQLLSFAIGFNFVLKNLMEQGQGSKITLLDDSHLIFGPKFMKIQSSEC
jgi:hypothetical protein